MLTKQEQLAKLIRILSVPPIMISVFIMILYKYNNDIFGSIFEAVITIVLLGFVPILAYPMQKILPSYKNSGREGQRKLAFVFNLVGYLLAFIAAFMFHVSAQLKLICSTYFLSVVALTVCNKGFHFRASGHASSFTGPLVLSIYFIGLRAIVPCCIVSAAIIWSSLKLKRHTAKELCAGIMVCFCSFLISLPIIFFR